MIRVKNQHFVFLHSQLGAAYVSATSGAVVTALGLKSLATVRYFLPKMKHILLPG